MADTTEMSVEKPLFCGDAEFVEVAPKEEERSTFDEALQQTDMVEPIVEEKQTSTLPEPVEEVPSSTTSEVQVSPSKGKDVARGSSCCSFIGALPPSVHSLIYWKNPVLSGAVLGSGLSFLLMANCCGLISIMSMLGLCALCVALVHRGVSLVFNKFTGSPLRNPFQQYLDQPLSLPEEKVEEFARLVARKGTVVLVELRRLFAIEDIPDSLKFGVELWLVYHVTGLFSFATLLILALILLFSLPKVYEQRQAQIDQFFAGLKVQAFAMLDKAKASPYVGAALNQVMPAKEKQS